MAERRREEERPVAQTPKFLKADINKIQCKDCVFRSRKDIKGFRLGPERSDCECYGNKPAEILYYGAECEYYVKE